MSATVRFRSLLSATGKQPAADERGAVLCVIAEENAIRAGMYVVRPLDVATGDDDVLILGPYQRRAVALKQSYRHRLCIMYVETYIRYVDKRK